MNFFYGIVIIVFAFLGIFAVIAGLPGTFIVCFGVLIIAAVTEFEILSLKLIGFFFLIAIIGEGLEYISGVLGARKYGGGTRGIMGAIIGGMVGAVLLSSVAPGIGTIIGVMVGTFGGAFIGEYISGRDIPAASHAAFGAFLGRTIAIGIKILLILAVSSIAISRFVLIR